MNRNINKSELITTQLVMKLFLKYRNVGRGQTKLKRFLKCNHSITVTVIYKQTYVHLNPCSNTLIMVYWLNQVNSDFIMSMCSVIVQGNIGGWMTVWYAKMKIRQDKFTSAEAHLVNGYILIRRVVDHPNSAGGEQACGVYLLRVYLDWICELNRVVGDQHVCEYICGASIIVAW